MSKINTIVLSGTKYQMGIEYGKQLKHQLEASLDILKTFYVKKNEIPLVELLAKADIFYNKYPFGYQKFIEGVAYGSGLSLDEVKILNGMETLNALIYEKQEISACSFIAIPSSKAASGATIIGRNYDFLEPFDKIAKYLTVTVLNEVDAIPTAFIAMPGQIYCPSCVNKESLFVELNNGMPSGGFEVNNERESLLINLLEALQNSDKFIQLDKQLSALSSDYSLIINVADKANIKSYEFSSFNGMKPYTPSQDANFISTNYYLNESWSTPIPSDETTWFGVSRLKNLMKLDKEVFTARDVMGMLDVKFADGGATWDATIYQMVFDTSSNNLYLKRTQEDKEWTEILLNNLFSQTSTHDYLNLARAPDTFLKDDLLTVEVGIMS